MRIGVLGAGVIAEQYLDNLTRFPELEVVAVADIDPRRAADRAAAFGVPQTMTPQELLGSDVELIVNLTPPAHHHATAVAILEAGKHLWVEKPLATNSEDAQDILQIAGRLQRRVGCAPDTVLGLPAQSALRAIACGAIGAPSWAFAAFETAGPQGWHPAPEFLFSPGGGPLMDMGPYYLTMLAHVFGAAESVHAVGATAQSTRVIGSGPRAGTEFPVTVESTTMVTLTYRAGGRATCLFSFDSGVRRQALEVTGSTGTAVLADPNGFSGDVKVHSTLGADLIAIPAEPAEATRGIGVIDLARAIREGRSPRAAADLAAHIVEIFEAVGSSLACGRPVAVTSSFEPVPALPEGWSAFSP